MGLPSVNGFGIKYNPLIDSPFVTGGSSTYVPPPPVGNDFILLNATFFLLLDGTNFLLL